MAADVHDVSDARLARIALPARLLREVDQLVLSGHGGYGSRQEFFLEAIQNHVLEVKHGSAEEGQLLLSRDLDERPDSISSVTPTPSANGHGAPAPGTDPEDVAPPLPAALADGAPIDMATDLSHTALGPAARGSAVDEGAATFKQEPLFGLHNRDYPSLWSLNVLAHIAGEGPVPASLLYADVTRKAWRFAASLAELEKTTPGKITALFPTNIAKPQSAEEGFRAFALGAISRKPNPDGNFETSGPLFNWQAVQLVRAENGTPSIGLTSRGWALVEATVGLTLGWPHGPEHAERFFTYLRANAPWDWAGFEQVMLAASERPNRAALAAHFGRWQPTWTDAMQNTNAAGFVARAREWGLLETKLVDGRYGLTELGESMLTQRSAS